MESLSQELHQLAGSVCPMWSEALSHAVKIMVRACRRLGYNPDDLGPDHLAILGSVFLGVDGKMIARDSE